MVSSMRHGLCPANLAHCQKQSSRMHSVADPNSAHLSTGRCCQTCQLMSQWPGRPLSTKPCSDSRWACLPQLAEDAGGDLLERGTRVTLHLKDDAAEYASDKKLGDLIKQYSEFIAFPIKLWAEKCVLIGHTAQCLWATTRSRGKATESC